DKGRIGLDIFRGDPRVVFAVVEAGGRDGGVYRSSDGGDTWEAMTSLNPRPMYFSKIRGDPADRNHVYLLGSNPGFYSFSDGGRRAVATAVPRADGRSATCSVPSIRKITPCGSIRAIRITSSWAETAASRSPGIADRPGCSATTCRSASSTRSAPTCRTRT